MITGFAGPVAGYVPRPGIYRYRYGTKKQEANMAAKKAEPKGSAKKSEVKKPKAGAKKQEKPGKGK
jgi:hypothetical protein